MHGDALFHLGRIRKLDDFGSLSLRAVDEFKDGGLHPGYAFPLWHGWLALVAKLARRRPDARSCCTSRASSRRSRSCSRYEVGRVVFRSTWLGIATMLAQVALIAFAPGGGGAYTSLELPGTVARQLLVPAAIDALLPLRARRRRGRVGAHARGRRHGPRVRPPDVRALRRDSARRLRARAAARRARRRAPQRRRTRRVRRAGAARVRVARADRLRDALAQPEHGRAADAARALRAAISSSTRRPSYHLAPGMVARTRCDRGRRARARAARRARRAPALERARARRQRARARPRALVARLPALLRSRLALAVAPGRRLRPVRLRARRRRRRGHALPPRARRSGRARGGDRPPARVPGELRLAARCRARGSRRGSRSSAASPRSRSRRRRSGLALERPGPSPRSPSPSSCSRSSSTASRTGGRRRRPTGTRSRRVSSTTCGATSRRARSSSPISRRAIASRRTRPCTSARRRPAHVADTNANRPYARREDLLRFLRTGSLADPAALPRRLARPPRAHEPVARVEAQGARAVYRDASFIVFKL